MYTVMIITFVLIGQACNAPHAKTQIAEFSNLVLQIPGEVYEGVENALIVIFALPPTKE